MDPRDVNAVLNDLEPAARPAVAGYLRELSAALPVSRRVRAAILAEIADGLVEEVNATRVHDPAAAARAALLAFGNPRDLAAQFARELTGIAAHRTGVGLVGTGPLVGGIWLIALSAGGRPVNGGQSLPARVIGLFSELPLIPVLLMIVIPAALLALAGSGRAARIHPVATGAAGVAALVAAAGCATVDVTLIAHALHAGGGWSTAVILAASASAVRLTLVAVSARRCARLRAAS